MYVFKDVIYIFKQIFRTNVMLTYYEGCFEMFVELKINVLKSFHNFHIILKGLLEPKGFLRPIIKVSSTENISHISSHLFLYLFYFKMVAVLYFYLKGQCHAYMSNSFYPHI